MASLWPHKPHTFRALARTYGQMWLRCDVCRRYARLKLAGLAEVDSRTRTFSCSQCGAEACFCLVEPIRETGMEDYRLDERTNPPRHPEATRRLTAPPRRRASNRPTSRRDGELPGRKIDPRR